MVALPLTRWFRRSARQAKKTKPAQARVGRRLSLECLEVRVVPTGPTPPPIDFGGLRFLASDGFTQQNNGDQLAATGSISIGYTPAATEDFRPLLSDDLEHNRGQLILSTVSGRTQFIMFGGELNVVAVGGSQGTPLPILALKAPAKDLPIDISSLKSSSGFSIPSAALPSVVPFELGKAEFTLSTLYFDNPTPGDTTNAQVKLQGGLSFDDVPLLQEAGIRADVNQDNYVIADHNGVAMTGATISKVFLLDKVDIIGSIKVGYEQDSNTFTFSGDVKVTTPTQGSGADGLNNVGFGLNATIHDGMLKSFGFGFTGSFTFLGLTVSAVGGSGQGFSFQYDTAQQQFEIGGGLQVDFEGKQQITFDFGSQTAPGIIIKGGQVQSFNGSVIGMLQGFGATLTTVGDDGLQVQWVKATNEVDVSGGLQLKVGTETKAQTISVNLEDPQGNPGLIIQNGKLHSLALIVNASFNIAGLKVQAQNATIDWKPGDNTFLVGGTFVANFDVFQSTLTLGDAKNPGLKIINGDFSVGDVKWTISNIILGPVTVNTLSISYASDGTSFDLNVDLNVTIVNKITVDADFGVLDGKFDSFLIDVQPSPGTLVIPDTGLSIVKLEAKVTNISNPSAIVVVGSMAVVWGDQIQMLGHPVYLFHAEGDVTADANELIIEATAQLGAYTNDNGNTWQGALGTGDAKLTLDWADNFYSLHVAIDGLLGFFDVTGDLVFSSGKEIALLATATVVVPSEIPFIGGDTFGGVGFFFQHVFAHDNVPTSTTFAAWLNIDIFTTFTVGFELVIDGNGHLSDAQLIGGSQVSQFEADVMPPVNQTYAFIYQPTFGTATGQVPPAATSLILSADWSQSAAGIAFEGRPTFIVEKIVPGQQPTYIQEKDFAANGISLISDSKFNGPSKGAVQIVGSPTDPFAPLTAQYALQVVITTDGGNPFPDYPNKTPTDYLNIQDTYTVPSPTFGPVSSPNGGEPPLLPSTSPTGAFPVTLQGNVDEGLLGQAKVTLYRISLADPDRRGVLIGSSALTATNIVSNPGFESPQAPFTVPPATNSLYWYNPSGASWTFSTSSGLVANGSGFSNPDSPDGTQAAFVQRTGSISQTVTFAAGTYTLNFQAAQRPGNQQTFQVLIDGSVVGTFQPTGAGYQTLSTDAFSVTAGSHTIEFLGTNANSGVNNGDNTAFIDSVSVVAASINVPGSGFDAPSVQNAPGGFQYAPTGSPWTFVGTAGIAANGSIFNNPNAPEGTQVGILQNNGSISQAVNFAAGAYTLSFQAVQRPGANQTFQVLVDGNVVGTFQPTGTSFQSYTTSSFRVTAGSHVVEFLGTDTIGGDNTAFIDSVSYAAEQTNWQATFNVPINGLNPGQYVLYSVINDGFNSPVASPNSVAFSPNFAVEGQITNQNNEAQGGWAVFLDYNNNGVQDPGEPSTTTNSVGDFSFTRTFGEPVLAPLSLTGFSQDVVFEAGTASPTVSHDFDNSGFAWFQDGATDTNHVTHFDGLQSYFSSQAGTTFQFQNFTGNNALLLGPGGGLPSSSTLTLTTPANFTTLAILASSSAPASPTGTVTVHYTDGSTGTFAFNAPDWDSGGSDAALPNSVARAHVSGNTFLGTDPNSGDQWQMFETDINTDPSKQVASLEFASSGPNTTGIFAVSGGLGVLPVPVNAAFKVIATPLAPSNFDPVAAATVTFNGTTTVDQPIAVMEHSVIRGTVFVDQKNDGKATSGQGVAGAVVFIDTNANGKLDNNELSTVTDASGHYSFANLKAGDYTVALDPTSLSNTTPTAAYVVPAGTVGSQANAFTFGESFTINKPIELTSLGAFDSGGDGFTQPITVVLYDQATRAILAQVTFTPDDPGTLVGGSRFKTLAQPITLLPGFQGVIAAYGFSATDPAGDAGANAPAWTTNNDVGRLTFNNGVFATAAGAFPAMNNASSFANPYAAGTFLFREPAWTQTADTPTTYMVTIDNSGYSVQEKKDFGALPPSYITGTITGNPLLNGQVAPDTVPLAGWTVNLLGDVPVAQIDAGGSGKATYGPDADFTGGTPATTSTDIDTSQVFNPAPESIYQSGRAATDGSFTYKFTGLTPGVAYAVRLHFAEIVAVAPGQREFNVLINGTQVLTNFDIFATAGAANTAIVKAFDTVADTSGTITITFTNGSQGVAFVNGVEILRPDQVIATTTSDAEGNYLFNQPMPGQYTIREAPPANWRQVSPFFSNPSLTSDGFAGPDSTAFITGAVMVTGDFTGKGFADIAVVRQDQGQRSVTVFYNTTSQTGSPPFVGITNRDLANSIIVAAVACDLNNDGRLDIAVLLQNNTVGAFLNTGSGEGIGLFQFVPNYWTLPASVSGDILTGFTAADLNHDGLDDLLLGAFNHSNFSGTVMVLLNNTNAAARTITSHDLPVGNLPDAGINVQAGPLAVADLNGDGKLDVIENGGPTSVNEGDFTVAFGDGKGGLSPWTTYELPVPLVSNNGGPVALGDIKGDGSQSAVLARFGTAITSVELALNRGNGVFDVVHLLDSNMDAFKLIPSGYQFVDVQLKDVNGDLKPDLVFLITPSAGSTSSVPEILVYLNTGSYPYYQMSDPFLFQVPSTAGAALNFAITDVNNDGLNDILVGTQPVAGNGGYLLLNTSPRKQPGIPAFVQAGAITSGNNFLNVQTPAASAVYGQVFEDQNRNAVQDTAETGSPGSFVFVDLNRNGHYDAGEPSAVTRTAGVFSIPDLPDGVYSVGLFPDADSLNTTPEFMDVTVDTHTAAEANFGLAARLIGAVSDQQANVNAQVSVTVPVTDNTAGHKLVYSLESSVPDGATIDPTTGKFTWTPGVRDAGKSETATVRVRDLNDPTFTETTSFTIQVAQSTAAVYYVRDLYTTLLGRNAGDTDLGYWVALLQKGASRQLVTQGIWESAEHRGLEVDQLYATYLHRAADAAGRSFWTGALLGGSSETQVATGLLTSAEYLQTHAGTDGYLTGVYADVLGRAPDATGLNFWRGAAQNGVPLAQIADAFLGSLEAEQRIVDGYYQTYLGRDADAAGAQGWLSLLQSGKLSPAQVAQAFLASDEFFARVAGS